MPLPLADLLTKEPPNPDWLIKDLVHRQQFVVMAGEAGVGKSFFWYTAAFGIALGRSFLGRMQCSQGTTLYFDDENSLPDLQSYLLKIWWAYGCPDPELISKHLLIEHFQLSRAGDAWPGYMGASIAAVKPNLVVVDTAASALGLQDENDNAEAARAVRTLRSCMSKGTETGVLSVLKHAKDGRIRGAKAWEGMSDQVIIHSRMKGKQRTDGYRNTKIVPFKRRTFGLLQALKITPMNGGNSVSLKSSLLEDE